MEQSKNDAAVMDAHTKLRKEDYALSMGQRSITAGEEKEAVFLKR